MTKLTKVKILVAVLLVVVMAVPMFSCKKDETVKVTHVFENRYINQRFYYSMGYPDNWVYSTGEDDLQLEDLSTYGNTEGYLCAKYFPQDEGYTGDVAVTVYKYNTNSMMNTLNGITTNLMTEGSSYYLNDVFHEGEILRDTFTFTSDAASEKPNHFQWNTANYSFVREGEDWKGKFYVSTGNNTWFFVVCMEAKVDKWDANVSIFNDMMKDFGFEGFEKSDEK